MRYFTLFIACLISLSSLSQNSIDKDPLLSIISANKYFHNYNIENFYLHTNKNLYFTEENIFFKAYVVNEANNKPSLNTSNLYINLYDFNNKLVFSHLFYTEEGTVSGSIKLPKDLKSGNYTLQLDTQWNKNFKEGSNFLIKIQNLNDTDSKVSSKQNQKNNTQLNTKQDQTSSTISDTGFKLFDTNADNPDTINFILSTNEETILSKENKLVYAALHKKGYLKITAPFTLSEKFLDYKIRFFKKDLSIGFNTISVFDANNQLLTEKSFYYHPEQKIDLLVNTTNQTKDSINLDLKLVGINKKANISLSVLHENTKVLDYKSSITNTLLNENLTTDDDMNYYLNTLNEISGFPYGAIRNKTFLFNKEIGLKLKGRLNTKVENPKDYNITLYSKQDNILLKKTLSADKSFEFTNLFMSHPSEYSLTLTDKKDKNKEGHFYIYESFTNYKVDSLLKTQALKSLPKKPLKEAIQITKNEETIDFPKSDKVEILDEVVLENVRKREIRKIKAVLDENIFLGIYNGFSDYYLIDEEKDRTTVEQYLRGVRGLIVFNYGGDIFIINRRDKSLTSIAVDGSPESQGGGFKLALDQVTNYELITYDVTGVGSIGNRQLNLISRKKFTRIKNKDAISKIFKTKSGYNFNKEKLEDNTLVYPNKTSENSYSTIDWHPDITLEPNSTNSIKIKKPENDNVKLIINGISEDGDLIYKVIDL